jgi:hypothetical protein
MHFRLLLNHLNTEFQNHFRFLKPLKGFECDTAYSWANLMTRFRFITSVMENQNSESLAQKAGITARPKSFKSWLVQSFRFCSLIHVISPKISFDHSNHCTCSAKGVAARAARHLRLLSNIAYNVYFTLLI